MLLSVVASTEWDVWIMGSAVEMKGSGGSVGSLTSIARDEPDSCPIDRHLPKPSVALIRMRLTTTERAW